MVENGSNSFSGDTNGKSNEREDNSKTYIFDEFSDAEQQAIYGLFRLSGSRNSTPFSPLQSPNLISPGNNDVFYTRNSPADLPEFSSHVVMSQHYPRPIQKTAISNQYPPGMMHSPRFPYPGHVGPMHYAHSLGATQSFLHHPNSSLFQLPSTIASNNQWPANNAMDISSPNLIQNQGKMNQEGQTMPSIASTDDVECYENEIAGFELSSNDLKKPKLSDSSLQRVTPDSGIALNYQSSVSSVGSLSPPIEKAAGEEMSKPFQNFDGSHLTDIKPQDMILSDGSMGNKRNTLSSYQSNSADNSPSGSPHTPSVSTKGTIPLSHAPSNLHTQNQSIMYGAPMASPSMMTHNPITPAINTAFPFNHPPPLAAHHYAMQSHHPSPNSHFHSYMTTPAMFSSSSNSYPPHTPRSLPPYSNNANIYPYPPQQNSFRNYPHSPSQIRNYNQQSFYQPTSLNHHSQMSNSMVAKPAIANDNTPLSSSIVKPISPLNSIQKEDISSSNTPPGDKKSPSLLSSEDIQPTSPTANSNADFEKKPEELKEEREITDDSEERQQLYSKSCRKRFPSDKNSWCVNCQSKKGGCRLLKRK
jgi:hypothetical protein